MTAYAIAHVHSIEFGPDVVEYLRRIDATLEPFEGRFLIHGPHPLRVEGDWQGHAGAVVRELPGYGHLDVLVGRRAPLDVFEPTRAWLVRSGP